tara:strand:- start:818 stop:1690 length:873 start_codon:yes stop_codon:yes gene_type:complete
MIKDYCLDEVKYTKIDEDTVLVFDRYEVDKRKHIVFDTENMRVMRQQESATGNVYYTLVKYKEGIRHVTNVAYAKLLIKCFTGQKVRREVLFLDGDKRNFSLDNLKSVTVAHNTRRVSDKLPKKCEVDGRVVYRWLESGYYISKDKEVYLKLVGGFRKLKPRISALTGNLSVSIKVGKENTTISVKHMYYQARKKKVANVIKDDKPFTYKEFNATIDSNPLKSWETRRKKYGKSGGNTGRKDLISDEVKESIARGIKAGKHRTDICQENGVSDSFYYKVKREYGLVTNRA